MTLATILDILARALALALGRSRAEQSVGRMYAIGALVYYQVAAQYGRAILGILWFALSPAIFLAIYIPILTRVFKAELPGATHPLDYPLFVVAGFLPWTAFADGFSGAASSLVQNPGIVKHSPLSPMYLPVVKVANAFAGLLIGLTLYLMFLTAIGRFPGARLLLAPVAILLHFLFTIGLSWFVASVSVYIRDVLQVLPTVLLLAFFASPIGFAPSMVRGRIATLLVLNPLASFMALLRASLIPRAEFAWSDLGVATAWAAGAFVLGSICFRRLEEGFGDAI